MAKRTDKIYCQICCRQIVTHAVSDDRCVGPSNKGALMLVSGVACHECKDEERAWGDLMEGGMNGLTVED